MTANGPQSTGAKLLFRGLCPLSFFYGLVIRCRNALYSVGLKRSYRAAVPVISVGNLTTGGTGKTPMIDFLAKYLVARNIKCAVISRGYGGNYCGAVGRVIDAAGNVRMTVEECGDEPYLLATRNPAVPVYVARKRRLGVQAAEQDGARLLLLDDGFQHLAVQRDADILLLDAERPFGNGRLIPAGMLREPLSAMQRADLVVMTRAATGHEYALPVRVPVMKSRHCPEKTLRTLDGQPVSAEESVGKSCLAFAGIARPAEFFDSLTLFGFRRIDVMPLADHQEYNRETLNRLLKSCHNYDLLVTTEKDAVKLSAVNFPKPCYRVGVDLSFDDITPLAEMLDKVMETCR